MTIETILNHKDFKMLWANDWYDGPLSGMALYKNEKCFYFLEDILFEDVINRYKWLYKVYKLTPEQINYEEEKQKCFVENVGSHFDFTIKEEIHYPKEKWSNYYSKYPETEVDVEENYRKNELIGEYIEYGEPLE